MCCITRPICGVARCDPHTLSDALSDATKVFQRTKRLKLGNQSSVVVTYIIILLETLDTPVCLLERRRASGPINSRKHKVMLSTLTLYVAVTQFTYGKLRHCYVKS